MQSDHKSLESIPKKPLFSAPKRLQGMIMRLQRYNLEVVYTQGKLLYLADTLSRADPITHSNRVHTQTHYAARTGQRQFSTVSFSGFGSWVRVRVLGSVYHTRFPNSNPNLNHNSNRNITLTPILTPNSS